MREKKSSCSIIIWENTTQTHQRQVVHEQLPDVPHVKQNEVVYSHF